MSKAKKDVWDKAQSVSVIIASLAIPFVLIEISNNHSRAMQQAENQVQYLELAVSILREEPDTEIPSLRDWAAELLAYQAKDIVPLSDAAIAELKSQRLPPSYSSYIGVGYSGYAYDYGGTDFGFNPSEPGSTKDEEQNVVDEARPLDADP